MNVTAKVYRNAKWARKSKQTNLKRDFLQSYVKYLAIFCHKISFYIPCKGKAKRKCNCVYRLCARLSLWAQKRESARHYALRNRALRGAEILPETFNCIHFYKNTWNRSQSSTYQDPSHSLNSIQRNGVWTVLICGPVLCQKKKLSKAALYCIYFLDLEFSLMLLANL